MNAGEHLQRLFEKITGLIFGKPGVCALCGSPLPKNRASKPGGPDVLDIGICARCLDDLAAEMSWVCQVCGAPLRRPMKVCPDCQKNLYVFDGQRSAGIYQGDLKSAITRMKYRGDRWLSRPLSHLMVRASLPFQPIDLLVPIPLEPGRLVRRGYNQAMDLAKEMSNLMKIPAVDILKRAERYAHQTELGRNMRWKNLRESMEAKRDVNLGGQRVLLVDDVTTTGATLDEAARVLKALGSSAVYCVTAARTMRR